MMDGRKVGKSDAVTELLSVIMRMWTATYCPETQLWPFVTVTIQYGQSTLLGITNSEDISNQGQAHVAHLFPKRSQNHNNTQ